MLVDVPARFDAGPLACADGGKGSSETARGSEYAELCRRIKLAGFLKRRRGWYGIRIALNIGLFAGGWVLFALLGNSWWQLVTAVFLAVMFTQLAFIGHDAGHRQIVTGRRLSDALGLVHGNLLVGLSYGWWVHKHNRHHGHPNQMDRDPDIGAGVFVFTAAEARLRRGGGRWLTRHQAYLFFPMLLLEGLNLHVASVRDLAPRRSRAAAGEAVLLVVHLAVYVAAVVLVLSPARAVAFVAVQQGLFGLYMGCAFAPNHKGMPILGKDDNLDFLRRQVVTSRNIRGGRTTDMVFGALNYQIEHHLFPSMPRPNLRRAQPMIREFCRAHDVSYIETSAIGSYREALRHLQVVGAPLREQAPVPATGSTRIAGQTAGQVVPAQAGADQVPEWSIPEKRLVLAGESGADGRRAPGSASGAGD